MKKIISIICSLMLISFLASASQNLKFVFLVTRHGARTPVHYLKPLKYNWNMPPGQLTPRGMREEYNLGLKLRKRYVDQLKFLSHDYKDKSIYAYTGNGNRTIESALCLLMGLYPPGLGPKTFQNKNALPYRFQVIPLRTVSENTQHTNYKNALKKYFFTSADWKNKNKQLQPYYKEWGKTFDYKIHSLIDIKIIADTLLCAKNQQLTLPDGLTKKQAELIIDTSNWINTYQFKNLQVAYIISGQLLNNIVKKLQKATKGEKQYKVVYFSGHDLNLLAQMSLLGKPLKKQPDFASFSEVELYNDGPLWIVKVRYNGNYIKLPIMNGKDYCSLKTFINYVNILNKKYKYV